MKTEDLLNRARYLARRVGTDKQREASREDKDVSVTSTWAKRLALKTAFFFLKYILPVLFIVFFMAMVFQSSAVAVKTAQDSVSNLLPWNWGTRSQQEFEGSDALAFEEARNDPEMLDMQHTLDYCLGEGFGQLDTIVAYATEAVDKGTKADYAQAWITYASSDPFARSAIIYHHPEKAAPDEGRVLTAEEIDQSGRYVYNRDEIYSWYEYYESVTTPEMRSVEDFVQRMAPDSSPQRFKYQINAAMWALEEKGVTTGGLVDLKTVVDSCNQLKQTQS